MTALKFPPDISLIIGIVLLIISFVMYITGVLGRRRQTDNPPYKKVAFWLIMLLMLLNTCNIIIIIIIKIIIPAWNGNPV